MELIVYTIFIFLMGAAVGGAIATLVLYLYKKPPQ